jgi:hypothetical protein
LEKLIVIPFVLILVVVSVFVGLLYSYSPSQHPVSSPQTPTLLSIKSAALEDVTLGESAPCSVSGLSVSCQPSFQMQPSDKLAVTLDLKDAGSALDVNCTGFSESVWKAPAGSSTHILNGTAESQPVTFRLSAS